MARYWMLYTREANGQWYPQFGDYSRRVVDDERRDSYQRQRGYGYEGDGKYAARDIKVIAFAEPPTQAQLMAVAATLND